MRSVERWDNRNPTGITPEREYLILDNIVRPSDTPTKDDTCTTKQTTETKVDLNIKEEISPVPQ
jgi:hypothetical protein